MKYCFPLSAAEILRQVRHLCKKLKAGPTSPRDWSEAGFRAILVWLAYCLAFPLNCPGHPAWQMASAPHVAAIVVPVRSVVSSSSRVTPFACDSFASSLTSLLISACTWGMYSSPLRCCVAKHLIVRTELAAWLHQKQQRQQELLQAVGSVEYMGYLWGVFAAAQKRVYDSAGGQSQLLGCKVPEVRLGKQWGGRVGGLQGMEDMEDVVAILWSCFKGHYLLLPAEQSLEYLMEQQQRTHGSSRSSSSGEDGGKLSAEDFARATRTAAVAAAAVDKAERSGESCELPSLITLGRQYNSSLNVGCLWLVHRPLASLSIRGDQDSFTAGLGKGLEGSGGSAAGPSSPSSRAGAAGGKGIAAAAAIATDGGGGADAAETAGEQAAGVSGAELRLMVNVMLLLWPRHTSPGEKGSGVAAAALEKQLVAQKLLQCFLEEHCWSWLLLLAAMLQQAPAEAKQQLMKEHGTLLLQLLYRVLLDHEAMGGRDVEKAQLMLTVNDLGDILKGVEGTWNSQESSGNVSWNAAPMSIVQLVLMVLQGLVFVADGGMKLAAEDMLGKGMGIVIKEGEP